MLRQPRADCDAATRASARRIFRISNLQHCHPSKELGHAHENQKDPAQTSGKRRFAIACQGGGSRTAFTAGALDDLDIVSLSGTSGGAACVTLSPSSPRLKMVMAGSARGVRPEFTEFRKLLLGAVNVLSGRLAKFCSTQEALSHPLYRDVGRPGGHA